MAHHNKHFWQHIVPFPTWMVSSLIFAAFLFFYTGQDKKEQRIRLANVLDVVLFRRGLKYSLDEVNKVLGLAGLSILAIRFCPWASHFVSHPSLLIFHAVSILCLHAAYSVIRYFNTDLIPMRFPRTLWEVRRHVALGLGMSNEILVILGAFGQFLFKPTGRLSLFLQLFVLLGGIFHFYGMESDHQGRVKVRPFGWIAPLLAAVTAVSLITELIFSR